MKGIITIIFALLLIGNVFASPDIEINKYSTDFRVTNQNLDQQLCTCGNIKDSYVIENTGSFDASFAATNNLGLYQNFQTIKLKPGQKAVLEVSGNLACETGNLLYELKVVSSRGITKNVERTGEINKCQNLQLSINDTKSILPGTTYTKTVQIINTGSFTETYNIKSNSLNNYLDNSSFNLEIEPYSSAYVDFVYEFTPGFYGNKTFKYEAKSMINDLTAKIEDEFEIRKDYGFTVQSNDQEICTEINNPFSVFIKNEGQVDNIYKIEKLSGRDYELSSESLEIESGESSELIITPNKNSPVNEKLRLKVTAEYGDISTVIEIPVTAKNCYALEVELPEQISHCGGEKEYDMIIRNTGDLYQEIVVESDAGEISDSEFSLEQGEERTVQINIGVASNTQIIIGSALGTKIYDIPTRTAEYCTQAHIEKENFVVRDSNAVIVIPIHNDGFADGTFEFSIDNDAELSAEELFIETGSSKNLIVNIDFSNREFGTYAFNLEIDGEQKTEQTISVEYKDKTALQKGINFLNSNVCFYFMIISAIFAIASLILWIFITPKERGSVKVTALILSTILIISALYIGFSKGLPQPLYEETISEPENLYYEIYENQEFILDLNRLFEDEDSDNLTFEVLGDDINYRLSDGIFIANDEAGNYEISFEASDGNDETTSPDIALIIKQVPEITVADFINKYCSWIGWLILLLGSLLFLGFMKKLGGVKEKGNFEKPEFYEKKQQNKTTNNKAKKTVKKTTKKPSKKKTVKKAK